MIRSRIARFPFLLLSGLFLVVTPARSQESASPQTRSSLEPPPRPS